MISTTSTTNPYHEISMLSGRIGKTVEQYTKDEARIQEIKKSLPSYHESMIAELENQFYNQKNKSIGDTISIKSNMDWHKEQLNNLQA
jgi:hypothetical protein